MKKDKLCVEATNVYYIKFDGFLLVNKGRGEEWKNSAFKPHILLIHLVKLYQMCLFQSFQCFPFPTFHSQNLLYYFGFGNHNMYYILNTRICYVLEKKVDSYSIYNTK